MKIASFSLGLLQTNCYIVFDEDSRDAVIIDPGYQDPRISAFLEEKALTLRAILLTHGHFDHTGGVQELQGENIPVYLFEADLALPDYFCSLDRKAEYMPLHEGDALTFGTLAFTVLHTPGHTPGSCCFQTEDCLFTGDTLFLGSCGRTDFPMSDPEAMKGSLRRLYELPENYMVLPGHGARSNLKREKAENLYMNEAVRG